MSDRILAFEHRMDEVELSLEAGSTEQARDWLESTAAIYPEFIGGPRYKRVKRAVDVAVLKEAECKICHELRRQIKELWTVLKIHAKKIF